MNGITVQIVCTFRGITVHHVYLSVGKNNRTLDQIKLFYNCAQGPEAVRIHCVTCNTPKARPPTATPPGRSPLSGACPCLCWLDPRTLWQLRLLSCPTRRQFLWRQSLNERDVVVLIVCTGSKLVSNFRKYWVGSHSDHSYQDKLYIMDIESKDGIEWISRVVCIIA